MPTVPPSVRVGIISDTHGLVRPEVLAALAGSDVLLHGGDIGGPEVLDALRSIAPLHAVRGNNDREPWAEAIPEVERIELAGQRLCLVHDVKTLPFDPAAEAIDVVIAGHTHRPRGERLEGVLYVNPGSAGPRRFTLPVSVGELVLAPGCAPEWSWVDVLTRGDSTQPS